MIRPPLESGDPTEDWPDIRLPPGTAAELIDADRGDGTTREEPLAEGIFPDSDMNATTSIVTMSPDDLLVWHGDTGKFRVWHYDRRGVGAQPFSPGVPNGTWTSIRTGHVLLWVGEYQTGQLLDWEPATGKYRLFLALPTNV